MRNHKKTMVIFTVLIIACALVYYVLFLKSSDVETEDALFEKAELEAVDEIVVKGPDIDSYIIKKNHDTYSLDENAKVEISEAYLTAMWQKLTTIEATYKADSAGSTTELGFNAPLAVVEYRKENGNVTTLKIGRYSSVRDAYYAKSGEENPDVYLIDAALAVEIMGARQGFYIKNLIDFSSEDDFAHLSSVEITGKGADFIPVRFEADSTWFHMSEPIRYICDYKTLKSTFLDPVMHLKGTKYVSDEMDASMGLDSPEYTITYVYNGEEIKVLVGSEINSMTYICRADKNIVFLINDEELNFLQEDYCEFIGASCYSRYINFVDCFQIEYQELSEEFDLNNAEDYADKWYAVNNGRKYTYDEFIGLYNAVMGTARNQMIENEKEEIDPNARITIKIKLKSGDMDIVEFKKISEREYEAIVNEECHFTVLSASVEAIVSKLNSLVSDQT